MQLLKSRIPCGNFGIFVLPATPGNIAEKADFNSLQSGTDAPCGPFTGAVATPERVSGTQMFFRKSTRFTKPSPRKDEIWFNAGA